MPSSMECGKTIRAMAKVLVLEFMTASDFCQPNQVGMRQSEIFRACGLDWGDYKSAPSTQQQFWIAALLRELESEGKVERVSISGPWRLS